MSGDAHDPPDEPDRAPPEHAPPDPAPPDRAIDPGDAGDARSGPTRLITCAAIGAAYLALLLAVYHRVWWTGSDRAVFGWDCLREYWPDIVFQARALGDGELPLWNPYTIGGYPAWGDPQTGLFSPVNWLLWAASWLSGSAGVWIIVAKVLLLMWLGLTGMHALVARRTGSHVAAAVAALVYVLGSPLLVHKNSSLLWPLLFLPWVVLALERYLDRPSPRRAILLGALVWLCGSAGSAQGFFYALLVVAPYWLYRLAADRRAAWRERNRHLAGAALCALTAGILLCATYLPAAQAVGETPRAERGLAYVLRDSLSWRDLGELVLPALDRNWMTDLYMGPLALVAVAAAVACARGAARRERLFWIGLALFSLLCALGRHGLLLPELARWVPGFGLFRIAYRYKLIAGFCVALLAGHGVAEMARGAPAWRRWMVAVLAASWLVVALAGGALWPLLLAGAGLALLVAALFDRARARIYLAGALALTLADLWSAGRSKIDILQPPPDLARDAALLARLDGTDGAWRYFAQGGVGDHAGSIHGRRELGGYPNPFVLQRMADVIARAPRSPRLARRFNVRWWLGKRPPGPSSVIRPVAPGVHELVDPAPLARLYGRAESLAGRRALDRLAGSPVDAAVVDPADAAGIELPASAAPPVDARLVDRSRNRVAVEVASPGPGILVLNEAHYPGWEAEVDGRPARVFRADHALRAVIVPAGAHRVAFSFRPAGLVVILCAFAAGLLLVACAALPWRRLD
jgi:hypothetical protein